jgi:glycine/D-amino acid oxidase-like deaminating enzyme
MTATNKQIRDEAQRRRIKALEEALRDALPRLENCFTHHSWHTERPPEPDYIVNIRALLKEADQ